MSMNPFDSDEEEHTVLSSNGPQFASPDLVAMESLNKIEAHWRTLEALITSKATDPFIIDDVQRKLTEIAGTAIEDESNHRLLNQDSVSPCIEYLMKQDAFERLIAFVQQEKSLGQGLKEVVMKFVVHLISLTHQPLPQYSQFLHPLLRLVELCGFAKSGNLAESTVFILRYLWQQVRGSPSLVTTFNQMVSKDGKSREVVEFPALDVLVDNLQRGGLVGSQAREAVLVIMDLCRHPSCGDLQDYIANRSVFAQMVASGLGACYAAMPTEKVFDSSDWWVLNLEEVCMAIPELGAMLKSLEFCDTLIKNAPHSVSRPLLDQVRTTFIQQVLKPAMLQEREEDLVLSTLYLTAFIKCTSSVQLMRELLMFVLKELDDLWVLAVVIEGVRSHSTVLSTVSLNLLMTLVDLNCEDVMLQLVLRYLMHGSHIPASMWPRVGDVDVYNEAAVRFLSLIPSFAQRAENTYYEASISKLEELTSHESESGADQGPNRFKTSPSVSEATATSVIANGGTPPLLRGGDVCPPSKPTKSATASASTESSANRTPPLQSATQHEHLPKSRTSSGTLSQPPPFTASTPPRYSAAPDIHVFTPKSSTPYDVKGPFSEEQSYFDYLKLAEGSVTSCASACHKWSSSYSQIISEEEDRERTPTRETKSSSRADKKDDLGLVAGPFVRALMEKVRVLLFIPHEQALLVTSVITRLARYPQPLLRSYLLRSRLMLRSGVPDLSCLLEGVKKEAEKLTAKEQHIELKMARARKTLLFKAIETTYAQDSALDSSKSFLSSESEVVIKKKEKLQIRIKSEHKKKLTTNALFCIVIFHEFLKELASVSQQHSVLDPHVYTPRTGM